MRPIKLHISPCPNDTFIFHAMTHGLVECHGLNYELCFDDIDELNRSARSSYHGEDVIKISYGAMPHVAPNFRIAESGSALGYGNGPLLVSRRKVYPDELHDVTIAIPGAETTAAQLLRVIYPNAKKLQVSLFSEIAPMVADGAVDAGVLIHEGRFTYDKLGLRLISDLGQEWEDLTGLPIPLGGIAINRSLPLELSQVIAKTIRQSIEFAMANPEASTDFVRNHARELQADVLQKHISYFVNDFSIALGPKGRQAIERLVGSELFNEIEFVG